MAVHVLALLIEKEPTNTVEGSDWEPGEEDVRIEVERLLVGRDLDTGWVVMKVV